MDLVKIGTFLQTLRKEKGLTQEQLAEQIGVARRTVSRWETGSNMPDLDVLIELSDFYEVDLREILNGERRSERMDQELKETVLQVADYSRQDKTKLKRRMRWVVLGLLLILAAGCVFWALDRKKETKPKQEVWYVFHPESKTGEYHQIFRRDEWVYGPDGPIVGGPDVEVELLLTYEKAADGRGYSFAEFKDCTVKALDEWTIFENGGFHFDEETGFSDLRRIARGTFSYKAMKGDTEWVGGHGVEMNLYMILTGDTQE